jgi:hypothetical protein
MADYPFNYKFTSVEVGSNSNSKIYQRVTYDLLNAFGDVGGVNEFLKLALYFFIGSFATITQEALITKYLYVESKKNVKT